MKKILSVSVVLFGAAFTAQAGAPAEFSAPWTDGATAIVIDPFEANSIDWDKLATEKRVVAIIHKATDGMKVDSKYAARKMEA